jgi:threonine dehydratase
MVLAEQLLVEPADIVAAQKRLKGVAWRTPLIPAGRHEDGQVHVKLECLQRTGSFKLRGAWNRMEPSTKAERARGFVTVSAGNHGQAVAWSARRLGARCTVWVPDTAVQRKVDAIRALGAEIRTMPHDQIMSSMTGDHFANVPEVFIHPFGDRQVMAGQGTIGLEILEDLPEVGSVLVPVGGGGLAVGVATAIKAARPKVKVVGVQAANAGPLALAYKSGQAEVVATPTTIADGIAASRVFEYMLPHLRRLLDDVVTVTEQELRSAVAHLVSETHAVAEPAGAASLAAARQRHAAWPKPIACIVSGGNIAPELLRDIVDRGG